MPDEYLHDHFVDLTHQPGRFNLKSAGVNGNLRVTTRVEANAGGLMDIPQNAAPQNHVVNFNWDYFTLIIYKPVKLMQELIRLHVLNLDRLFVNIALLILAHALELCIVGKSFLYLQVGLPIQAFRLYVRLVLDLGFNYQGITWNHCILIKFYNISNFNLFPGFCLKLSTLRTVYFYRTHILIPVLFIPIQLLNCILYHNC